jgi:hypothetical protein
MGPRMRAARVPAEQMRLLPPLDPTRLQECASLMYMRGRYTALDPALPALPQ